MKISFIIPARNEEQYIGKTIESILQQPRRFIEEIIVVDNGCTDRTAEKAGGYSLTNVVKEPIPGTNRSRQAGYLASQGELVATIDADVRLPSRWSERMVDIFSQSSRVVGVSGPYWYPDCSLIIKCGVLLHYGLAFLLYLFFHDVLKIASVGVGGNFVIRRSALDKIGGFNVSLKFWGDDTDTAKRLCTAGLVKFSPTMFVISSARRFRKRGWVATVAKYTINYLWIVFFNRPFTQPH